MRIPPWLTSPGAPLVALLTREPARRIYPKRNNFGLRGPTGRSLKLLVVAWREPAGPRRVPPSGLVQRMPCSGLREQLPHLAIKEYASTIDDCYCDLIVSCICINIIVYINVGCTAFFYSFNRNCF